MPDVFWILKNKVIFRKRYKNLKWKEHEPQIRLLIAGLSGKLFVDIGSNEGIFAEMARKKFKKVVTIDPDPKYKADIQVALGNRNWKEELFVMNYFPLKISSSPVKIQTWDSLGLDANLIKIDVEGAEFEVIEGINLHKPQKVIIEL